jgi:hypothetical protein
LAIMKNIQLKPIVLLVAISHFAWVQCAVAQQSASTEPKHLATARALVAHLDLSNTDYELGGGTVKFTSPCVSRTDCSGFADALLTYSYGCDADQFRKWFGSSRPSARRYHDAIDHQKGFRHIEHVQEVLPGDFLAVKYLNRKDNTGHVMLVAGRPQKISPTAPLEPGTVQWKVDVIDSSKSGHGPTDTRHKKGADGKDHAGLGEGVFRIYTDSQGTIDGFAWSTLSASKYIEPKDEDLVIGRLQTESAK